VQVARVIYRIKFGVIEILQSFLITFREGLEMSLIVVIVLAYLIRTGRVRFVNQVWIGVSLAAVLSIIAGGILFTVGAAFEGRNEKIFEGMAMILTAGVLTWMIIWMKEQARGIRGQLEGQVELAITQGSTFTLASIAFLAVIREGLETVLFLFGVSQTTTPMQTGLGGFLGLLVAVAVGWILYRGSHRINFRIFLTSTGVLLILFAAGLLAHGIHELQEAGLLPIVVEHVWNINFIVDEKGTMGSLFKGLFGYNGNPSLLEVVAYPTYLILILAIFFKPIRETSVDA